MRRNGAGVLTYIETESDHQMTAFLAGLSVARVLRDRVSSFSRVEWKRQVFLRQKSEVEERRRAEYQFTEKQLDIAKRVLAAQEAGK